MRSIKIMISIIPVEEDDLQAFRKRALVVRTIKALATKSNRWLIVASGKYRAGSRASTTNPVNSIVVSVLLILVFLFSCQVR